MYIKVRVSADAAHERVEQESADHFKIMVREKAERNMANKRIIKLIALHYGVSAGKVRIISGHHAGSKILSVTMPHETR